MSKLLIPFFSAGYPELNSTRELISLFAEHQADYIEIGLPHSDALADGPVIQESSQSALENGMNIELLINQVSQSSSADSKLILFSYFNPIVRYGLERTVEGWARAGGHAILVPDLPVEEAIELQSLCQAHGLRLIFLVAPTSDKARIDKTIELSEDFIYLVSVTGVTGTREANSLNTELKDIIQYIKSKKPEQKVVIGFGISSAETAENAIELGADGVVIGSAIMKQIKQDSTYQGLNKFIESIKERIA